MAEAVLATLDAAAARCGCGDHDLHRFAGTLQGLSPLQSARINPFNFAEAAGIRTETALDLFVHGAKLGLFDLEWGMVCPLCGAITHSVTALDRVDGEVLHCSLCDRDVDAALDDTVEVSFAYLPPGVHLDRHQDFDTYRQYYTSASYPYRAEWQDYHARHKVADIKLSPGETAEVTLPLAAGEVYRLACLDVHSGVTLQPVAEPPAGDGPLDIALSDQGFSQAHAEIAAGGAPVRLSNHTDQAVWCWVVQIDMTKIMSIMQTMPPEFGPRLTGKHLLNNQAFRDCFALHELAPDLKLKLRSLTLLFTDLKGSTALYDREGDLAAYRLVQDHFTALKQAVRSHSGAMIKTMGDAVMAAFPSGDDGTAAAIAMMRAMQGVGGDRGSAAVGLKVGLHAGPALAINAGNNVDYFGQTVNIAARVQGLADAGEICLTAALNDNDTVPALLTAAGYRAEPEQAHLKGVTAAEQIYRYRADSYV